MSILKVDTIQERTSGNGVVIPSGQTLDVSAGTLVPSAGAVIQVKNVWSSTQVASTTDGNIDLGLDINITPTSTSSQFLLFGNIHANIEVATAGFGFKFLRGGTTLAQEDLMTYSPTAGWRIGMSVSYMDTPSTTSQITYKLQPDQFGPAQVRYNETGRGRSSFTVMEIAG